MKKGLLLSACLMTVLLLDAKTIFVKAGANGNGASWGQAFGDLQQALKAAVAGDQIWVARGTYTPTQNNDRKASFQMKEGVAIYGGFAGNETQLNQRSINGNKSILSGEIGTSSLDDNSFTIVYAENVSKSAVIDGFEITSGVANGFGVSGDLSFSGAAMFNKQASPTVKNCTFKNNYAREGAAIYNFATNGGTYNPIIANCNFIANKADFDGGAIFNMGQNGQSAPIIRNCHFEKNRSTYGAAILNKGANGKAIAAISNCVFTANASILSGAIVYNLREGRGESNSIMNGCKFIQNDAVNGDAFGASTVTASNNAQSRGGAVLRSY
ncbi:MAG: hypothetical protein HRU41_30160 [Saprospiraceae bacterium]|nr:hypothetical protein [Saprospiraceae bacterium]